MNQLALAGFLKGFDKGSDAGKIVLAPEQGRDADTPGLAPQILDLRPGPVRVLMHDDGLFPVVLHGFDFKRDAPERGVEEFGFPAHQFDLKLYSV